MAGRVYNERVQGSEDKTGVIGAAMFLKVICNKCIAFVNIQMPSSVALNLDLS